MKKLKLDLDRIQVVSFAVETTKDSAGTVNGFSPDTDIGCGGGFPTDDEGSCRFCNPDSMWDIC
ncbi:MAG TPA: hypothetical protein VFJ16_21435 [Longimicrobium sp.]|nr:hypothetical protein [Longimicrobium sp.]